MKVINYRQQEYNEKCRIAFYEAEFPLDTPADFVTFEYEFTSDAGADGIATITFDNEVIATIRESETPTGIQQATHDFTLREPGTYNLRVETVPQTDTPSEFTLSNFQFGYHPEQYLADLSRRCEDQQLTIKQLSDLPKAEILDQSTTGTVTFTGNDVTLDATGGPAWVELAVSSHDPLGGYVFDTEFTSAEGSEGLLAVYHEDPSIGTQKLAAIDERVHLPGERNDSRYIPATAGDYTLSFRLDSYADVPSKVAIRNIQLINTDQQSFDACQEFYEFYYQQYSEELTDTPIESPQPRSSEGPRIETHDARIKSDINSLANLTGFFFNENGDSYAGLDTCYTTPNATTCKDAAIATLVQELIMGLSNAVDGASDLSVVATDSAFCISHNLRSPGLYACQDSKTRYTVEGPNAICDAVTTQCQK